MMKKKKEEEEEEEEEGERERERENCGWQQGATFPTPSFYVL